MTMKVRHDEKEMTREELKRALLEEENRAFN
jgi:hypothetical protein